MAAEDEYKASTKLIKRYVALMITLAGFEIEEMKKMNLKLELYERMETLAQEHARKYQEYEPGVTPDAVIEEMKTKRNKGVAEMIVDGALIWRRFREIKRIVNNELTPVFLSVLNNSNSIPSGLNLSWCLQETQKRLFERKRKDASGIPFVPKAISIVGGQDENLGGGCLETLDDVTPAEAEKPLPAKLTSNVLKAAAWDPNWFPPEWLVFITLGIPVKFMRSPKYPIADAFNHEKTEGLRANELDDFSHVEECTLDDNHMPRSLPLSRKRQREVEKMNYSTKSHSTKHESGKADRIVGKTDPDIIHSLVKKVELKEKQLFLEAAKSRLSAAKDLFEAAKEMDDMIGKTEAYNKMKLATAELECLFAGKELVTEASSSVPTPSSDVVAEQSIPLQADGYNESSLGSDSQPVEISSEEIDQICLAPLTTPQQAIESKKTPSKDSTTPELSRPSRVTTNWKTRFADDE